MTVARGVALPRRIAQSACVRAPCEQRPSAPTCGNEFLAHHTSPGAKVLTIAAREYKATVRTKAFLVGLLLAPVIMGGSAIVMALTKDRVDTRDKRIAVVDHSGLVADAIVEAAARRNEREIRDAAGRKVKPAYGVEIVVPGDEPPDELRLRLSDRVRKGELHAFVEVGRGIVHPGRDPAAALFAYHARNPALDDVRSWVAYPVNERLRRLRLQEAGVDAERIPDLFHWIAADGLGLLTRDEATGAIRTPARRDRVQALLLPLILPVLIFLMVMMGAQPLLGAVVEEKSQRIAEVMLGSIRPFPFMLGKLLGGVAVSLTAATVYVVIGILTLRNADLGAYVPYGLLPWFFVFLICAVLLFGSIFSAVGASCSDASEVQAIALPVMLPLIVPMFVLMPVVIEPLSGFATGLSLFPPFTPMLMLLRMGTPGGVPGWQPWLGLAGVLACTVFFAWVGGRIFRVGILLQGTPPRLGNLLRWAVRG